MTEITFKTIVDFIRIRQYYKNIVIFLPLVFSVQFFSFDFFYISILGFISLCLISSGIYIRNDISDKNYDKFHSEKNKRPIPSGKITVKQAWILFFILVIVGFSLSFSLSLEFGIITLFLFLNGELYSKYIKNIVFLDVFSIAGNFIIRVISGIILIQSNLSPWMILGVFFVALFLGFIKRKGEFEFLKEYGTTSRQILNKYTEFSLNSAVLISAVMIIVTYSLYSINGPNNDWRLILTVPFIIFVIFRQLYVSSTDAALAQKNELLGDKQTVLTLLSFTSFVFYLIYFAPSEFFPPF